MITDKAFAQHCQHLDDLFPPECGFVLVAYEIKFLRRFSKLVGMPTQTVDITVGTNPQGVPADARESLALALRKLADEIGGAGGPASDEPE